MKSTRTANPRRKTGARPKQAGIALIFVMISVTVLGIMAAIFAFNMKVETKLAQNANSEIELLWLGRSGVEAARWVLSVGMTCPYVSLDQKWAGGSGSMCETNGPLADVSLSPFTVGGTSYPFSIKITDLERKFNINVLPPEPVRANAVERALQLIGLDAGDSSLVKGAILDWMDPDDGLHPGGGAESSYYQGMDPPYSAKNMPIDDLSELLLVRGVTPEIYWGGVATNRMRSGLQNRLGNFGSGFNMPVTAVGLSDLFTPLSNGRININTASAEVLQLIPGIDAMTADAIVAGRQGGDDGTGLLGPYKSVDEVTRLPEVNPALIGQLKQYCDVHSHTFEVQIDAEVAGYKRQFTAILARNSPKDVQVLSFYWKE